MPAPSASAAAAMRGRVAFDATCSCGWDSRTGGAVRSYVEREVWLHKRIDHATD